MKITRQLARLEPMVLHPVHGLSDEEWHHAPAGRWTVAQIVEHLAVSVDLVAQLFEERGELPLRRRHSRPHETVLRHLVLISGRIPRGLNAVAAAVPSDEPEPDMATAQFRMGVELMRHLAETWPSQVRESVFLRHPYLGDLNLPEWVRFHYVHSRHHMQEIRERLRWLGKEVA